MKSRRITYIPSACYPSGSVEISDALIDRARRVITAVRVPDGPGTYFGRAIDAWRRQLYPTAPRTLAGSAQALAHHLSTRRNRVTPEQAAQAIRALHVWYGGREN